MLHYCPIFQIANSHSYLGGAGEGPARNSELYDLTLSVLNIKSILNMLR